MEVVLPLKLHSRQQEAFFTPATEVLFGGASEGGKSHFVRVALITWCLAIPGLQCCLIRKKYDDIINNHLEGPKGFRSMLAPVEQAGAVKITLREIAFSNGSRIVFQHCQDERQFDSAQGVEKHVLVVDEAPQISERLIRFFRGWVRMPMEMQEKLPEQWKGKFPRIIYTGNPIGVSIGFFRRHFVKARETRTIEKVEGFLRQYIPSRATDNPSVDLDAHKGRLAGIGDEALAKALDEGDWDTPVGDFFPEYDETRHVTPDFTPPRHWFRFRSFDWGTAEPFAVYWWAVSDGESFTDHLGRLRWFPRGALIAYREWYGCDPESPAKGLRMRNEDVALGILARSLEAEQRLVTLTDSLPFQDRGGKTIAETFADCGCPLTQGDTSRIPGWSQLRSRLVGAFIDSNDKERTPMLFVTASCRYARDYIPALPRHKSKGEDAEEDGEATHSPDAIRIACMARPMVRDAEPLPFDPSRLRNSFTFDDALQRVRRLKAEASGASY